MELAAEQSGESPGERQTQAESYGFLARFRHIDVEDPLRVTSGHAGPFILDSIDDTPVAHCDTHLNDACLWRILDGVAEQIDENLLNTAGVGFAVRKLGTRQQVEA